MDRARVDRLPGPRKRLEEQIRTRDLDQHKALILIEASGFVLRPHDVAAPELPPRAFNEVVDALLRREPLVEMLVAGENNGHTVPEKERLEDDTQVYCRPVRAAIGV